MIWIRLAREPEFHIPQRERIGHSGVKVLTRVDLKKALPQYLLE